MQVSTRRDWLKGSLMLVPTLAGWRADPENVVYIREVRYEFEDFNYRTPIKFGGRIVDRVTLLNVRCTVEDFAGRRRAEGFGSMPLGNVWSFPSRRLTYDQTLDAMKALAERIARITREMDQPGHPIEINHHLEPVWREEASALSRELRLVEPIPNLAVLVTASPFDAAIHDGYGKLNRISAFQACGSRFLGHRLDRYLGEDFKGESLDPYILPAPRERMPMYHLVGAVDPLEETDVEHRINDGLPETLPEWIRYNGLTHIKIKLNGDDLAWDVERVTRVERATAPVQESRGVGKWFYSLDFNERCPDVEYLLEFLARLKATTPQGLERIQYIEQPTARDLRANPANRMHRAAAIRPVVIDESLVDLESLLLARELGYTGVALKACKGQSQSLLMAAAAQKYGMFRCVQDLTCPGASLIHSVALAAHIPGVAGVEANSRQYVPAANRGWEERFPGIFRVTDGTMRTGDLKGWGLGAVDPA
ncbi:MAG: mandelate racemase/muconate lactonizing enzyme family protein [Acidobacteriota bacterium]